MHLFHQRDPAFSEAKLTEWMLGCVAIPNPLPGSAVFLMHIRSPAEFVVLAINYFLVFFAVWSV